MDIIINFIPTNDDYRGDEIARYENLSFNPFKVGEIIYFDDEEGFRRYFHLTGEFKMILANIIVIDYYVILIECKDIEDYKNNLGLI